MDKKKCPFSFYRSEIQKFESEKWPQTIMVTNAKNRSTKTWPWFLSRFGAVLAGSKICFTFETTKIKLQISISIPHDVWSCTSMTICWPPDQGVKWNKFYSLTDCLAIFTIGHFAVRLFSSKNAYIEQLWNKYLTNFCFRGRKMTACFSKFSERVFQKFFAFFHFGHFKNVHFRFSQKTFENRPFKISMRP